MTYLHRASKEEFLVTEAPGAVSSVYRGRWQTGPNKGDSAKYTKEHFERCFVLAPDASDTPLAVEHGGSRE